MARSVDQMTLAELEKELQSRKKLQKEAPKLQRERAKLEKRIEEIDEQLKMLDSSSTAPTKRVGRPKKKKAGRPKKSGRGPGRPRKSTTSASKSSSAPKTSGGKLVAGKGRLPRGAVQNAILDVLGSKTLSPSEISEQIAKDKIEGISPKSVSVAIDKMKKAGRLIKVDRGQYKKA